MTEVYWICLLAGAVLAIAVVLAGDVLDGLFDGLDHPLFDPLSVVGGLAVFGGAGLVLDATTALSPAAGALVASAVAAALAVSLNVFYTRPMKRAENSTAFSHREYAGRLGEVNTPVPARGYGEVLVRMGASTTFQTAASADGTPIPKGTRVVVVEVEADGTLRVAPFDEDAGDPAPSVPPPRLQTR